MAVIDKDGSVKDVRVESGLPKLAQAAIDAVRQWRYKQYVIEGEPIAVENFRSKSISVHRTRSAVSDDGPE